MFSMSREKDFETKRVVLIVDDDVINGDILSSILEETFEIRRAYNGQECLDILKNEHDVIDLVLLDIMMPIMSGTDILKIRKDDNAIKKIPFIVMTSDREIEEECFKLGVNDFIKKPYENPEIIIARIKRMIELYEDRSVIREIKTDKLTSLYSFDFFKKFSNQNDAKYPDLEMDMLAIKINNFHLFNELYGKEHSEQALIKLGTLLKSYAIENKGVAGRNNEDTFLLYAPHIDSYQSLMDYLDKEMKAYNLFLKYGIYQKVEKNLNKDILIGRSKSALNLIGDDLNKRFAIFDEKAQKDTHYKEQLVSSFETSLANDEFKVFYQPKYNIQGEKNVLVSAEALIRWMHPTFGMISPGLFIPLFEKNGLIQKLDAYVFKKVAHKIKMWKEQFGFYFPVSVNISRVDIYNPDLQKDILEAVTSNDIPHDKYYLEITESAFGGSDNKVIEIAKSLKEKGFKIEIDDFGTGYSSLNMLSELPFDVIKIDMGFIRKMHGSQKNKDIIELIIAITKRFNGLTVAEGVENKEQYDFLKEKGCDIIQGYYFSKPLPENEFSDLLRKELL